MAPKTTIKNNLSDKYVELIEDKLLGRLMKKSEEERNIPLLMAKKLLTCPELKLTEYLKTMRS